MKKNIEPKLKIELSALSKQNLGEVWNFLKKHEKTSIALFSHLIENNKACLPKEQFRYFLVYQNNEKTKNLLAVFMISKSGLIFHQFADNLKILEDADIAPFEDILKNKNIYSIIGKKEGTEFFQNLILKIQALAPRTEYLYHYLRYNKNEKKTEGRTFPLEYTKLLKWNTIDDLDALSPLQALYDQQEVIPPFKDFDPELSKANLKRLLLTQKILSLQKDGHYVAKAGTNAIGYNWVQIGGVCTKTDERNRGYAQFLVQNLISYFQKNEKKQVALFVKENNESAKKAYYNLGFVFDSYFKIVYY
ncbi:MAG TPA: GNAT family N-acetyltransferase [Treponemataceae bacterium]|nr:GNAT family N-acetyltransferase [Treponemataceae bacterium]HQC26605.1 GNAT family N-acetyltransferase [Treponemataceae bacterium]